MRNPERDASGLLSLLLMVNFGAVFLGRNALGYLMPFISPELGLSNANIGLLSAGVSLMWAVSGFGLTALIASRTSPKRLLVCLGLLIACATFASALAGSFAALLLLRVAYGLFGGPVMPITQTVVAAAVPRRHRALQMSLAQSVGSNLIAAILGPAALVPIATRAGWRIALMCDTVLVLLTTTLVARFLAVPPSSRREPASAARGGVLRSLLTQPNVRCCGLISVAMVGWLITSVAFYPLYLIRVAHASGPQMGMLMTAVGVGGLCGSLLLPHLSDLWGRRPVMILGTLLGLLGPVMLFHPPHSQAAMGVALLLSALGGGTFPLFMATIPAESLPPARAPTGMGLVQGLGESVGGVGMPYLAGLLADAYGLQAALVVIAGCALTAAVVAASLKETAPHG